MAERKVRKTAGKTAANTTKRTATKTTAKTATPLPALQAPQALCSRQVTASRFAGQGVFYRVAADRMNSVLDALQSCPSLIGGIPDRYVCTSVGNYAWKRWFLLNPVNFTLLVLDNHHFFCDLLGSFQLFNLLSQKLLLCPCQCGISQK